MKCLLLLAFIGVISAAPLNQPVSPAMRQVLVDMLKGMISQHSNPNFKPMMKPIPPMPPMPFKPNPPPAFLPPQAPLPMPQNNSPGGGLDLSMPTTGTGAAYNPAFVRNYVYCPPGPTSSDSCKDQKMREALYFPNGEPRYPWVPRQYGYDLSIPDNVKDTAGHILMMKINSRPNRRASQAEMDLMSLFIDPKDQFGSGPAFNRMGPRPGRRAV